jgi:curved DNA-binding protein CbpA
MSSYYDVLGVPPMASEQDIRRAFRSKAKQLHPDVNASSDAHQKFLMLQKAYQTLTDKQQRFFYDNRLHAALEQSKNAYNRYASNRNNFFYNNWAQIQKERAEHELKLKQEKFLKNRKKFRSSVLYYPSYFFIYIATFFCYLLGTGILTICAFIAYYTHIMFLFVLSPFICGGIYFIKCTYDWFKESRKYF